VEAVITTARDHLAAEAQANERSKRLAQSTAQAEINRLQAQNAMLGRMLAGEKAKTSKLRTELVQNMTQMIVSFTDAQDQSWSEAVGQVQVANDAGAAGMGEFNAQVNSDWEKAGERQAGVQKQLAMAGRTVTTQRASGQEVSVADRNMADIRRWAVCQLVFEVGSNCMAETRLQKQAQEEMSWISCVSTLVQRQATVSGLTSMIH
jgi:kinesin family protein 11